MLPIEVIPAPIDFLEATYLVQAVPLATQFKAGHELNQTTEIIGSPSL